MRKDTSHKPKLTQKKSVVKIAEIAKYLRVHPVTARQMCRRWQTDGSLSVHKDGKEWWIDREVWLSFCQGRKSA